MYQSKDNRKETEAKIPIYKGCLNERCFCSGDCMKIVGYKNKKENGL